MRLRKPTVGPNPLPKDTGGNGISHHRAVSVGVIIFLVGAIAATYYLRSKNAWVEETETGLITSWGQKLEYAKVSKLEKSKWETKGIAKAFYFEKGQRRIFTFDDFKFDRAPLGRMLYNLEQVIPFSKVVGGPLESPPADLLPPPAESLRILSKIQAGKARSRRLCLHRRKSILRFDFRNRTSCFAP